MPPYDICQYTEYLKRQLGINQVFAPWQLKKLSDIILVTIKKDFLKKDIKGSISIEDKEIPYKANTQPIEIPLVNCLGVDKTISVYYCVYLIDQGTRKHYTELWQQACFGNNNIMPKDLLITLFWNGKRFYNFLGADIKLHNQLYIKRAKRSWRRTDYNEMAQELIANEDQRLKIVGYLFHFLNNYEQDGYVNGLFGYLNSNYKGCYIGYNEAFQHSTIPNIRWCCDRLSYMDKDFLNKALKNYGYNTNTFYKWVKKQIKRLEWKTPKVYEAYLFYSELIDIK